MTDLSFTVTYYNLFLGDQDGTTGWYRVGYTLEQVEMIVGSTRSLTAATGLGFYSRHDAVGLTNYSVEVGSIVRTTHGLYYKIMGMEPVTAGDVFGYYRCDLQQLIDFPFIQGFFGFEDEAHRLETGGWFDESFERGYWAIS